MVWFDHKNDLITKRLMTSWKNCLVFTQIIAPETNILSSTHATNLNYCTHWFLTLNWCYFFYLDVACWFSCNLNSEFFSLWMSELYNQTEFILGFLVHIGEAGHWISVSMELQRVLEQGRLEEAGVCSKL